TKKFCMMNQAAVCLSLLFLFSGCLNHLNQPFDKPSSGFFVPNRYSGSLKALCYNHQIVH
ncbi:MAG: hypothetical protein IJR46_02450, partial [Neisseriaceae bacterium]|nr:hypothetical protein [Neisseriaceae bacterium]